MQQGPDSAENRLASRGETDGVTVATLTNGLKIVVKEDHRTPVAICHVWVRVGSNQESDGVRGWAHGIEHLIFKGTDRRDEGDFAREVAEAGGITNAGTGYETTSYHITVPSENIDRAFDILADALFGATFAPDSLDAERKVLVHENHMYDDIPYGFGITWRWGLALAFDRSPYRYPICGEDEGLLGAPREDIVAFYRARYRPDNMTAVVVGDVETDQVLRQLAELFGGVVAGPAAPATALPIEPEQRGLRFLLKQGDIQKAYAKLIFHGVSEVDPDRPVLSVVRRILADGRSSRLYRIVHQDGQLVSNISLIGEAGPREGVLLIDLETDCERLLPAIKATAEVLEQLKTNPPGAEELVKAQVRVQRSFLFGAETVQGQAGTIGYYDAMGDLPGAFHFPERVTAVTAADVCRFCRRVFRRGNLTALLYLPQRDDPQKLGLPQGAGDLDELLCPVLGDDPVADNLPAPSPEAPPPGTAAPVAAASPAAAGLPVAAPFVEAHLGCGLPVYYRVDRTLPVVSLGIFADGGASREEISEAGLASLTTRVQIKGTADADAKTIHGTLEGLGASLSPLPDRDSCGLSLTTLSRHLEETTAQLCELACAPAFPAGEIEREHKQALDQLEALKDDPFQAAGRELRATIYGDHPYGRPLLGLEETIPGLGLEDLRRFHRRTWVPENLRVVVSGDIDPDRLLARLDSSLADLPVGPPPGRTTLADPVPPGGVVHRRLGRDLRQSVVFIAWPGQADPDRDRCELLLWKQLLNGQNGRLFEALRNRRSLCYNCGVLSTAGFGRGMIAAYILTDPATEEEARRVMLAELAELTQEEVPEAEFARARAKLLGNLLIGHQANTARVTRCAGDLLYGRGPNDLEPLLAAIQARSPAEIRRAAAGYIDLENRFEVVLGPVEES